MVLILEVVEKPVNGNEDRPVALVVQEVLQDATRHDAHDQKKKPRKEFVQRIIYTLATPRMYICLVLSTFTTREH